MNTRKTNKALTTDQVKELNNAWHHASRIQRPLNTLATFRPFDESMTSKECCDLFARIRNKVGVYARKRKIEPTFVWTIESNKDGSGLHLHVLVHIPTKHFQHFEQVCLGWLTGAHEVDVRRAHQKTLIARDGKRHNAISYISKQMSPQACFGRGMRRVAGGPVLGKRGGVSANLTWKACGAYKDARDAIRFGGASAAAA